MNDGHKEKVDQLREALNKLFEDAGYVNQELADGLDAFERLAAENERLKLEAAALRKINRAGIGDSMSSRLKDALRE